jgi:mono/diheme cytochrome c family protein
MSRLSLFLAVVLGFVLTIAVSARAQQSSTPPAAAPEYKIPPAEAAKANPVKPTPESLERGKTIFGYDCAACHGKNGDGKGDVPIDSKHDFTDPNQLKDRTDGELAYIIRVGKGLMPAEGNRGKPDDIWNIVNYVRSLSKK